jgi:hypothetical protein
VATDQLHEPPDAQDYPFMHAPEPQGQPLLSDGDTRLLSNFFNDVGSNQYSFTFGEGLNFSDEWLSELPPTFMGTATSYGQQPAHSQHMTSQMVSMPSPLQDMYQFGHTMMPPPPHPHAQHQQQQHPHSHHLHHQQPPQHQQAVPRLPVDHSTQADVAAVLTALQSGHGSAPPTRTSSASQGAIYTPQALRTSIDHGRPPPPSRRSVSLEHRSPVQQSPSTEGETLFTDMVFGSSSGPNSRPSGETTSLQWGSDANFARAQPFVPSSRNETYEAQEQERMNYLRCFELNKSATNTRPSSPSAHAESSSAAFRNGQPTNGNAKEDEAPEPSPRKRRKSKVKEEGEEAVEDVPALPPKSAARKRKSKVDLNGTGDSATGNENPGKRRRSGASGSKPPRENLTDAQKRENHIKSEQRRRGAIKEGFDDLSEIVPNLKTGGYSKSMMLTVAGDWLQNLLEGNAALS